MTKDEILKAFQCSQELEDVRAIITTIEGMKKLKPEVVLHAINNYFKFQTEKS